MSAPENGRTHGRDIPYARFSSGKHSADTAPGTDAQRLRANQQGHFGRPPSWDQVTNRFFTVPPRQRTESGRHRVTTPEELLFAGINAATAAAQFGSTEGLAEYLRQKHQQLPANPTQTELMALIGADCVRLGMRPEDRHAIITGLAQNPDHISTFSTALSTAADIRSAVSSLLPEQDTQPADSTALATIPQPPL